MNKVKRIEEWFSQAEYDIDTANVMFENRRYIYCIFMCHLSLEKALKGLYVKYLKDNAPKIHNLVYFAQKLGLNLDSKDRDFLESLNEISIPTRYPEELRKMLKEYSKKRTQIIFIRTKEVLKWLRQELKKQL